MLGDVMCGRGVGESSSPISMDHHATCTFIETRQRMFRVTADHELAKIRKVQAQQVRAGLAVNLSIGAMPFSSLSL